MNVFLYSFKKRPNSTKQPPINEGTNILCQLKDETSFLNPILKLSKDITSGVFSPSAFNYCMIPYWERYYYITDWTYLNGIWEAHCVVDPLASFKTAIGNTSAYVIRSSSSYNGNIIDNFYPATTQVNIQRISIDSEIYRTSIPSGCYVVGCINKQNNNRIGSVVYYAMNESKMCSLMSYLFSDSIFNSSDIDEIGEGLYKSLFDPFQYIVSCMWFPFSIDGFGTTTGEITVGYWGTGVTATIVRNIVSEHNIKSVSAIPLHPQSASRGDFLNHSPFTKLTAYYPPFGEIPINTDFLQYGSNNYLWGKFYIDYVTGIADIYWSITNGNTTSGGADPFKYFTMRTAQVGVPIQISQVITDYISTIGNGVNAIASGFMGNIAGIFGNILSAAQSSMPKASTQGANGSFIEIIEPPYLEIEHMRLTDENNGEFGRPLCSTKQINTLTGFLQCGDADHEFPCTKSESDEINRNMKQGFFYE